MEAKKKISVFGEFYVYPYQLAWKMQSNKKKDRFYLYKTRSHFALRSYVWRRTAYDELYVLLFL